MVSNAPVRAPRPRGERSSYISAKHQPFTQWINRQLINSKMVGVYAHIRSRSEQALVTLLASTFL